MADHMREALAKLLDVYDARRSAEAEREQRAKDDEARFLTDFAALRRDVIRPVFEAAGAMMEERGHRYSITEQEFAPPGEARASEASITLRIVPSGTKAPLHQDQRSLTVATRHYNRTAWINSGEAPNSGGLAGASGAFSLDKISRQLVEDEVVAFVAKVVAH